MVFRDINDISCKNTLVTDVCGPTCSKFGGAPGTACPASATTVRKFYETFGHAELLAYISRLQLEDLLEDK